MRNIAECDREGMAAQLAASPAKAAAWGDGRGISAALVPDYLRGLTPATLRSDTLVTNHGYVNGRATPFLSVMQAGTAVLVDEYGVPRVRCSCGNPLTSAKPAAGARYSGAAWKGFSPSAVTQIQPASAAITDFTLVTPTTGESFKRPRGTSGSSDR
jgi:hypothetical protein